MIGTILQGNNLKLLKRYPDCFFDAVVTDSPYGLAKAPDPVAVLKDWVRKGYHRVVSRGGFMGKDWDAFVPQPKFWSQILRVLKPGGHVLSFFAPRTYHWGTMAMQLAGLEIRDQLQWVYGQGFPKSVDLSKAIDKAAGATRQVVGIRPAGSGPLKNGHSAKGGGGGFIGEERSPALPVTLPATDAAKQFDGWGTALKPAYEPIVLARRPLDGTQAQNALKWATGGLNLKATAIPFRNQTDFLDAIWGRGTDIRSRNYGGDNGKPMEKTNIPPDSAGRFPANLILDEQAAGLIDRQSGQLVSGKPGTHGDKTNRTVYHAESRVAGTPMVGYGDQGGASRFFYVAKASGKERNAGIKTGGDPNRNPCVKPLALMRYLVRLISPLGGTVLDPFAGSGTTGCACEMEQVRYVLMEQNPEDIRVARARCGHWAIRAYEERGQMSMFDR